MRRIANPVSHNYVAPRVRIPLSPLADLQVLLQVFFCRVCRTCGIEEFNFVLDLC